MDDPFTLVYALVYGLGIPVGIGFAVWRGMRSKRLLNRHDGRTLEPAAATRVTEGALTRGALTAYLAHAPPGAQVGAQCRVSGLGAPTHRLAFRITATGGSRRGALKLGDGAVNARFVVDSTTPDLSRALLSVSAVQGALLTVCGAKPPFARIDLYRGADLVIELQRSWSPDGANRAPVVDLLERLLRFAEAMEAVTPTLDDTPDLGAASGASGSPVTFSIDIRR